jgi:hypothetical protein
MTAQSILRIVPPPGRIVGGAMTLHQERDVVDLAQLDSGDLVVAAAHTAAPRHDYLTAVTPLGSLDPAWNATGPTPGVLAVADQLAGVTRTANAAVVAGIATGGVTKVRRYAANGTPDASFGSSGVLTLPAPFYAHGIDVGAADGKYYVAGSSGSAPGAPLSVARVLPSGGMLDPAFASSGVATVPVRGVGVVTAAAGSFVYVFGPSFIARLTSVGLVDLTFGTGGALSGFPWPNTFSTFVVSGGVQPSGKAVVVLAFADAADSFPGSGAERVNVASTLPPAPGSFVPLAPVRVLDTRTGTGAPKVAVGAAGSLSLPVGVGASAVVLTVTAVAPTRSGFVTVYPSGTARPTASNLNHPAGATTPNLVTVPVGSDGKVVLYNGSSGTVHLLADVLGFYVSGTPALPGAFAGLPPARILDTRNGTGAPLAQVPAGGTLTLNVAGRGGVPSSGVSGVVLNATVVGQTKSGYLTLYPAGSTRPVVSNLNFYPGTPRANLATVRLGLGGALSLYNASTAPVDLVADVAGYYLDGTPTAPGMFVAVDPIRILDTRIPSPHPIASHRTLVVPVPSIPAHAAMVMNATSTSASQPGFATFRGASRNPFDTSTLNFVAGQTTASLTVTAGAAFLVYNGSTGTIHAIADLAGYFLP